MKAKRALLAGALPLALLAAMAVTGTTPAAAWRSTRWHTRHGWLILTGRLPDVGGRRLEIEVAGSGSPAVVMDAGLCQSLTTWGRVPSEVAKLTRVLTYNRAGLG